MYGMKLPASIEKLLADEKDPLVRAMAASYAKKLLEGRTVTVHKPMDKNIVVYGGCPACSTFGATGDPKECKACNGSQLDLLPYVARKEVVAAARLAEAVRELLRPSTRSQVDRVNVVRERLSDYEAASKEHAKIYRKGDTE